MRQFLSLIFLLSFTLSQRADAQGAIGASEELLGSWRIELLLDSASALAPNSSARIVTGRLAFGAFGEDSAYDRGRANARFGRFDINLSPFFGSRVAPDVSTSIVAPFDTGSITEAVGELREGDSLRIILIPRMSHGGLTLEGVLRGDSAFGAWQQNAYCCGAYGRFRMVVESRNSPQITPPPRPAPPPPLDTLVLGRVRLRVWEESLGRYVRMEHGLREGIASKWVYHTSASDEGWGKSFWLPPGEYAIEIRSFPCGDEFWPLQKRQEHPLIVRIGETTELTLRMDLRTVVPGAFYGNPTAQRCPR